MADNENEKAVKSISDRQERLSISSKRESKHDSASEAELSHQKDMTAEWQSFYAEVKRAVEQMRL